MENTRSHTFQSCFSLEISLGLIIIQIIRGFLNQIIMSNMSTIINRKTNGNNNLHDGDRIKSFVPEVNQTEEEKIY